MRFERWLRIAVLGFLLNSAPAAASTPAAAEYELKAAFLYNFALYAEWPVMPDPVYLCVLGPDPFGPFLDRFEGRDMRGSRVSIRRVASAQEARTCQVLFIAASEHGRLARIQDELAGRAVLTVTEGDGFDRSAVMIVIVPESNRLTFEVNLSAVRQAGMNLSSKMLKLARKVY